MAEFERTLADMMGNHGFGKGRRLNKVGDGRLMEDSHTHKIHD